jgi:hypothetical protein
MIRDSTAAPSAEAYEMADSALDGAYVDGITADNWLAAAAANLRLDDW